MRDYEAAYGVPPSRYSETGYTGAQLIVKAVQLVKGDLRNRDAVVRALRDGAERIGSPRGQVRSAKYGQGIPTRYVTRTEKKGGTLVHVIIDQIANLTQESTWGWWLKDMTTWPSPPRFGGFDEGCQIGSREAA